MACILLLSSAVRVDDTHSYQSVVVVFLKADDLLFYSYQERQSLLKMIDEQQQMEENELTFTLSLEQNEEAEKLRKVRTPVFLFFLKSFCYLSNCTAC